MPTFNVRIRDRHDPNPLPATGDRGEAHAVTLREWQVEADDEDGARAAARREWSGGSDDLPDHLIVEVEPVEP